jgi:hypothetical protein
MPIYRSSDGQRYLARNLNHLVTLLRQDSFVTTGDNKSFMREMAARIKSQFGTADIPTDSVENFVQALILAGLVTEESTRDHSTGEQSD